MRADIVDVLSEKKPHIIWNEPLTRQATTPQNGQTHSNKSLAVAEESFECVWLFRGVGA